VTDFLRRSSVLCFGPDGLSDLAGDVRLLAEKEGLTAHSASVSVRLHTGDTVSDKQNRKGKNAGEYMTQSNR
jgi:hypothetical protein